MISSNSTGTIPTKKEELEALQRLCQYVGDEAAHLCVPEAGELARVVTERIRERLRCLMPH